MEEDEAGEAKGWLAGWLADRGLGEETIIPPSYGRSSTNYKPHVILPSPLPSCLPV